MAVSFETLDYNLVEFTQEGDCGLCGAEGVPTIDLMQNLAELKHVRKLGPEPGPWACLECCQRIHETLTAALQAVED